MCKLVTPGQAAAYDAAVRGAWQLVLGLEMTDDSWERATYPLKRGGLATGTVETRASAAYMSALSRTMPEVLRRTGFDGVEALRRDAPALDRSIVDAAADLQARGVPAAKVPFAGGNGTAPPTQKDIVAAVNDKRYEDRLASLDDDGRGQLRSASGSGSAAFLLMPTQQDHRIEDPLFRVAVVRRLGGRVAPKADHDAQPHCALVAADGTVCGHPSVKRGGTSSAAMTASYDGWLPGSKIALVARFWSSRRPPRMARVRTVLTSRSSRGGDGSGSTLRSSM